MNKIMVFVKAPVPGKVKTRLCPPLSSTQAATLYTAFVKDTLAAVQGAANSHAEVFYDPAAEFPNLRWTQAASPPLFFPQQGDDLGTRLEQAFQSAFSRGAPKAVAIGSDTPHITPVVIERAFSSLERADLVLGPTADGGYYLIGLKEPCSFLFQEISWSTVDVLRQTLERARQRGLKIATLPTLFDVDTISDLRKLAGLSVENGAKASRFTKLVLDELSGKGALGDAVKR